MLWKEEEFECNALVCDAWFIHFHVKCKRVQDEFALTVIYAPNELAERYVLWEKLSALKNQVMGPLVVVGDFNNLLDSSKHWRGANKPHGSISFSELYSRLWLRGHEEQ